MTLRLLRLAAVCLSCCLAGMAQKPSVPPVPAPQPPPQAGIPEATVKEAVHELTPADAEAFLDGFMPMQLERENIAGAVVCIVKDGKVFLAKGYGYADVEKKTPVSVDRTLFRPGSISKLFTWTAVMQLEERGKFDLDHDVNEYLDFTIPATYPQPITLRRIMTHTAGFEETVKDLFLPENIPLQTLGEYLKQHIPRRIFPPGTMPAYSNYGAALAGYIVERVSGRPFNDYVEENIFRPLRIAHSTFVQPLPPELKPLMSKGYNTGSGRPKGFEVVAPAPAGALAASADDLSRFMIAHLQDGEYEGARLLRPETARLMHYRHYGLVPDMDGMALGFYEETRNGHRIIGHGGDTIYFHSDMHLMVGDHIGFLVSYNSAGLGQISPRSALWQHFLDRYFPYTPPESAQRVNPSADARLVAGDYMTSRRSESGLFKLTALTGELQVTADPAGLLRVNAFKSFNGETRSWREIGPLVFRDVHGQDLIAFVRDGSGRLTLVTSFPAIVYQRVSWWNSRAWNSLVFFGGASVLALNLLLWPLAAAVRKHYGRRLAFTPRQGRLRDMVYAVCALQAACVLGLIATAASGDAVSLLSGKLDPWFHIFQWMGVLGLIGTLPVLYACWRICRAPDVWPWTKFFSFVVMLACIALAWFALHWNMLRLGLRY